MPRAACAWHVLVRAAHSLHEDYVPPLLTTCVCLDEPAHGVDQFPAVQQRGVVVIGASHDHQFTRLGRSFEEPTALLQRHDAIAISGNDQHRRPDALNRVDRAESIAKQPADGQDRVVEAAHIHHRRERRTQDQRRRRMFDGQPHGDRRSERFAEVDETIGPHITPACEVAPNGTRIVVETALGRTPAAVAEPAIVEEQHGETLAPQRRCEWTPIGPVAGVAVEHNHRWGRWLRTAREKPPLKGHAICCRDLDGFDVREAGHRRRRHVTIRKVNQRALPQPDQQQHAEDGENEDRSGPHAPHLPGGKVADCTGRTVHVRGKPRQSADETCYPPLSSEARPGPARTAAGKTGRKSACLLPWYGACRTVLAMTWKRCASCTRAIAVSAFNCEYLRAGVRRRHGLPAARRRSSGRACQDRPDSAQPGAAHRRRGSFRLPE